MTRTFRFSNRPHAADRIAWQEWGRAAFDHAAETNRPVLLNLTTVWGEACHEMDVTTFSDPGLAQLINENLVAVRVDADRFPHVQDRYIAGGWPTNAFLTPSGGVMWAGTFADSASLTRVIQGVVEAWNSRREEFEEESMKRRRALASAQARRTGGLVRREAADDVMTAARAQFDARNGGFGDAPKFPPGDLIELLYLHGSRGEEDALLMADHTLDGMLAGDLLDRTNGGFFRYATSADWTAPQFEKLLEINAIQLEAYALGASVRGRPDWLEIATNIVQFVDDTLALDGGYYAGSQYAHDEFFAHPQRVDLTAPPIDTTIYTSWNAMWFAALANAGGRLQRSDWIRRAETALGALLATMRAAGGLMHHFRAEDGPPTLDGMLSDSVETARACVVLFEATGDAGWMKEALSIAHAIEKHLWADDGGFWDRTRSADDVDAMQFRERPFETNARAARVLLDIATVTGERGLRALAERTLARLSPQAGRYGVGAATFALAVEEYFAPPPFIALVGSAVDTTPLRAAALALPHATRRVWSLPEGGRIGTHSFPALPAPAAYACGSNRRSAAVHAEQDVAPAMHPLL